MGLAVFDIGGSAVKYGYWENETLTQTNQFKTPETFEVFVTELQKALTTFSGEITGIAMSAPGAVNVDKRQIEGISAVPYIHHRPIYDELEAALGLPVTIENDANCAGICEVEIGAGKGKDHAAFVVIGTGIGGAIFINGKIYKGAHLFGGEFGLMLNSNKETLSINGTAVNTAARFGKAHGIELTGKELFARKDQGDSAAAEALEEMYQFIAEALYNIQVSLDPEIIIIGGGISARPELSQELGKRLHALLAAPGVESIMPEITTCQYENDANLIGAALNFQNIQAK